jgi:hypothetical protein
MINQHKFLGDNDMDVIRVKNKEDVVKAADLLEKIGILVFKNHASKINYLASDKVVENNFMIKEKKDENGWRIQSHFITDGISPEELEIKINDLLTSNPDFKGKTLQDEIAALKEKVKEYENKIENIEKILNKNK